MKKIILSLTLMGVLATMPGMTCMANVDSPNEKVEYKKTSIEEAIETSEISVLVDDLVTPKCKCEDEKCTKEKDKSKKKEKGKCPKVDEEDKKKEEAPRVDEKIEKIN